MSCHPAHTPTTKTKQVAQVLQLVVQHGGDDVSLQSVASLLQLNSSIRTAMQQAVGNLSIPQSPTGILTSLAGGRYSMLQLVTSLATWLPKHAGLVKHLVLYLYQGQPPTDGSLEAAEQLITFSLEKCAAHTTGGSSGSSALQLQSFASDCVFNPTALQCLAAATTLTHLRLLSVKRRCATSAFAAALGHLQHLRFLNVNFDAADESPLPLSFTHSGLAPLTQLEHLQLGGYIALAAATHLPSSLTGLVIMVHADTNAEDGPSTPRLDLSHLSKLKEIELYMPLPPHGPPVQTALPSSLTAFSALRATGPVPGIEHLVDLLTDAVQPGAPLLQRLPELPQLRHLAVGLAECYGGAQVETVMEAIGCATQLHNLSLYSGDPSHDNNDWDDVDCAGAPAQAPGQANSPALAVDVGA